MRGRYSSLCYEVISREPVGMLLPCRFCTRMSLICPMNSSRSNQSSHSCPAIWSRGESWSGSLTKLPRLEEEKLPLLLLQRAVYCPAGDQEPYKPGTQGEITGGGGWGGSVTGRTSLVFTGAFYPSQRCGGNDGAP